MRRFFACLLITASLYSSHAHAMLEDYPSVKLQGLDKSVGRTVTFEAKVGSTIQYGPLYIKIQSCRKAPPIEKPESASFLQIWEVPPGQNKSEWVFSGWMFASSPALSAMDHPVYDVWVLGCTGRDDPEPETVDPDADAQPDAAVTTEDIEQSVAPQDANEAVPADSEAEDQATTSAPSPSSDPAVEDSEVPPAATQTPSETYNPDAPYNADGAYTPDGAATIKTAPPQTQMPEAPAPTTKGPTPGTAYELMNMSGAHPSVSKRDGATAYDYR